MSHTNRKKFSSKRANDLIYKRYFRSSKERKQFLQSYVHLLDDWYILILVWRISDRRNGISVPIYNSPGRYLILWEDFKASRWDCINFLSYFFLYNYGALFSTRRSLGRIIFFHLTFSFIQFSIGDFFNSERVLFDHKGLLS